MMRRRGGWVVLLLMTSVMVGFSSPAFAEVTPNDNPPVIVMEIGDSEWIWEFETSPNGGDFWVEVECQEEEGSCPLITLELLDGNQSIWRDQGQHRITVLGQMAADGTIRILRNDTSIRSVHRLQASLPIDGESTLDGDLPNQTPLSGDEKDHIGLELESTCSGLEDCGKVSLLESLKGAVAWNGTIWRQEDEADAIRLNSSSEGVVQVDLIHTSQPIELRLIQRYSDYKETISSISSLKTTTLSSLQRMQGQRVQDAELWLEISAGGGEGGFYSLKIGLLSPDTESEYGELQANWCGQGNTTHPCDSNLSSSLFGTRLSGYGTPLDQDGDMLMWDVGSREYFTLTFEAEMPLDFSLYWYNDQHGGQGYWREEMHTGVTTLDYDFISLKGGGELWMWIGNFSDIGRWIVTLSSDTKAEPGMVRGDAPDSILSPDAAWIEQLPTLESSASTLLDGTLLPTEGDYSDCWGMSGNEDFQKHLFTALLEVAFGGVGVNFTIYQANPLEGANMSVEEIMYVSPASRDSFSLQTENKRIAFCLSISDAEDAMNTTYSFSVNLIPLEQKLEPKTDEEIGLLAILLLPLLLIALVIVLHRRRRIGSSADDSAQTRLKHLRQLLDKGIKSAERVDISLALGELSDIVWGDLKRKWGAPSISHSTKSLEMMVWKLNHRMAKMGGMPLLLGLSVKEDLELAALKVVEDVGPRWSIIDVEPNLIFDENEVFLDSIEKESIHLIFLEVSGEAESLSFHISALVDGVPIGAAPIHSMSSELLEEE